MATQDPVLDINDVKTFRTFSTLCNSIITQKDNATFAIGGSDIVALLASPGFLPKGTARPRSAL